MELNFQNLRDCAFSPPGIGVLAGGTALAIYAYAPAAGKIGQLARITSIGLGATSLIAIAFSCAVLWTVSVVGNGFARDISHFFTSRNS